MKDLKVYLLVVGTKDVVSNTYSKVRYNMYTTSTLQIVYNCSFESLEELHRFAIVNEISKYSVKKVFINFKIEDL